MRVLGVPLGTTHNADNTVGLLVVNRRRGGGVSIRLSSLIASSTVCLINDQPYVGHRAVRGGQI